MKNRLLLALLVAAGILPATSQATSYVYRMPQVKGMAVAPATGSVGAGSLSANSLTFPSNIPVGFPSASQTIQYSNAGPGGITLGSLVLDGPFLASHNCPMTVPAGASCQISVSYVPTVVGPATGSLQITSDDPNSPYTVALSGAAVQGVLASTPTALDFDTVAVGNTKELPLSIFNKGDSDVQVTSFSVVGNGFSVDKDCTNSSLGAKSSSTCDIKVRYTPTLVAKASGRIDVLDSAGHQARISLSGTSVSPGDASFSVATLTFPATHVGATSDAQTVTLSNTGAVSLDISTLAVTGPFSMAHTCPSALAAGAQCDISVTYRPTVNQNESGSLSLSSPLITGLRSVGLQGSGQGSKLAIVNPSWVVNGTTATDTLTVSNKGNLDATLASVEITGDSHFTQTSDCVGKVLPAGGSATCTITVTLSTTVTGPLKPSYITVTDSSGVSASSVLTSGILASGSPSPYADPAAVAMGYQVTGTSSSQTVAILPGITSAVVSSVTVEGDSHLTASQACVGKTLSTTDGGCSITVTYAPTADTAMATSHVKMAYTGGVLDIPVSAGAMAPVPGHAATTTPASLSFDSTPVGIAAATKTFTLANTGQAPLTVRGSWSSVGDFSATHDCPQTLAVGSTCTGTVTFKPTSVGNVSGVLHMATDASVPATVDVSGVGLGESLGASAGLEFGALDVLSTPASKTITFTNSGNVGATVTGVSLLGDSQYTLAGNTCANSSLAAGQTCSVTVSFAPTAIGQAAALVKLTTLAGKVVEVSVSGTGRSIGKTEVSATALHFGSLRAGQTSTAQSVLFSNTGTVPVNVSSIETQGPFSTTHNCPGTVAANASCTLNVAFQPVYPSVTSGYVQISTDAANNKTLISLDGTGTAPILSLSSSDVSFRASALNTATTNSIIVSNTGTAPAVISDVTVTGDRYTATNDCKGKTLAVGGADTCTVNVTYTATAYGVTDTGRIQVLESGVVGATANLNGISQGATPQFSVDGSVVTSYNAGKVQSTVAVSKDVVVSNTGDQAMTINSFTGNSGSGVSVTGCAAGTTLQKGQTCTATVTFTPGLVTTEAPETRRLTLTFNNTQTAAFAIQDTPSGGWLAAAPDSYDFAARNYGSTYQSTAIVVTNKGTQPVTINPSTATLLVSSTTDLVASHNCPSVMAAGASCSVVVNYTPGTAGFLPANTHVTLKADGLQTPAGGNKGEVLIAVQGSSNAGQLSASTGNSLSIQAIPGVAKTANVVLSNTGNGSLTIGTPTLTGTNASKYSVNMNGCTTLSAGGQCTITVTYTPSGAVSSPETATLNLAFSGAPASPYAIALSGATDNSGADPYWANVVTLQSMDSGVTDSKSNMSFTTTAGVTTTATSKFGSGALTFSAYTSRATNTSYPTLSGDFTVEFWGYPTNSMNWTYGYGAALGLGLYGEAGSLTFSPGSTYMYVLVNGGSVVYAPRGAANTWHHYAVSRTGATTKFFIDGAVAGDLSSYLGTNPVNRSNYMRINGVSAYNDAGLTGWSMDELRITNGVGRYTGSFTVPTKAFPNY